MLAYNFIFYFFDPIYLISSLYGKISDSIHFCKLPPYEDCFLCVQDTWMQASTLRACLVRVFVFCFGFMTFYFIEVETLILI